MRKYIKGVIIGKCKLPNPGILEKRSDTKINELRGIVIYDSIINNGEEITAYSQNIVDKKSFEPPYPIKDLQVNWQNGGNDKFNFQNIIIKNFEITNVLDLPESNDRYADFSGIFFGTVGENKQTKSSEKAANQTIGDSILGPRIDSGSTPTNFGNNNPNWWKFWFGVLATLFLIWLLPKSCSRKLTSIPECTPDTLTIVKHDTVFIQPPYHAFTSDSTQLISNTQNISMMVGDHSVTDHDTISIYVNGELIADNFEINKEEPQYFNITLQEGENELRIETKSIGTEGDFASPLIIIEADNRKYHLEPKCRVEKPFIYKLSYFQK